MGAPQHPVQAFYPSLLIYLEYSTSGANQKFGEFDPKKCLTVTPTFHRLLRSSPLGHVYSDPSFFSMISCTPGSSQM